MVRGFVVGVVFALVALAAFGFWVVVSGHFPVNADVAPSRWEKWAAHTSLRAMLEREAPQGAPPIPLNEQNLRAGLSLYRKECQDCHGAADGKPSAVAEGLYQPAPQLAKHGVEDDPEGWTFWKITHGIRLTGMPSFGRTLSPDQIWQLTLFLKHMDALPLPVQKEWLQGAPEH